MERIDGKTLTDLIHTDREDLRRLLGYLAQAADGIAKAHTAGVDSLRDLWSVPVAGGEARKITTSFTAT